MHEDTIGLLGDCTAGIDMALSTLDDLLPRVDNATMRQKILGSMADHKDLKEQAVALLHHYGGEERGPSSFAQSMAWMKINGKMALGRDDATAADLVSDGCDSGVRALSRSRNRYAGAETQAINLAQNLIRCEERLSAGMRPYL